MTTDTVMFRRNIVRKAAACGIARLALLLAVGLAVPAGRGYAAGEGNNLPAVFTITKDILVSQDNIAPIGVNRAGDPGGCKYSTNAFIRGSGNEPFNERFMARVIRVFDDGCVQVDSSMSRWNGALLSGYYSGASVRVYRLVDKGGNKLPAKKPNRNGWVYMDPTSADHVVFVGKTNVIPMGAKGFPNGGWIAETVVKDEKKDEKTGRTVKTVTQDWEKSRVRFTDKIDFHYGDYLFFEKRMLSIDPGTMRLEDAKTGTKTKIGWHWQSKNSKISLAYHTAPIPADMFDAGESCLKVEAPAGSDVLSQPYLIGGGTYYGDWEDGRKYRLEVWLRQEGLEGTVDFSLTGSAQHTRAGGKFQVTDQWQRFTCDFIGRKEENLHGVQFTLTGPGTLWMDNCRIFPYDNEQERSATYTPGKLTLEELLDSQPQTGPKGVLRFWSGLGKMSMNSLLSMHGDFAANINWTRCLVRETRTIVKPLMFTEATGQTPETRMVPWLIIQVTFTEQDYRDLIEYLGAPYDPKKDTPESKPYAFKRYQQRGHGRPWTDTFREIIVEFGNENWHNRYAVFPFWVGFGELSAIHQGGKEYGIFTRYYVEEIMKSPYWKSEGLDKKIRFCLGGNYSTRIDKTGRVTGYGQEATQANGYNAYEGHAVYVGPLWELKQDLKRLLDDDGFQGALLAYAAESKSRHENTGASLEKLREQGYTKHEMVSYEGGPSGFSISGKGLTKEDLEATQILGHSLAMGVSALDCWLDTYRLGWKHHAYYFYGQGKGWNSHSEIKYGFLPSPAFMAMEMRNRCLRGDMLVTKTNSTPTITYGVAASLQKVLTQRDKKKGGENPTTEIPLVNCYSFRDGNRYSVAIVSLKLDGKHNGQDFGDGYSPVTLNLPFRSAGKITLQKLVGDPRDTNMTEEKIKLVEQTVPASAVQDGLFKINETTGGGKNGMPPGTAFMVVFEDVR